MTYAVTAHSAQAKASIEAAGLAAGTAGIAADKRPAIEWADRLLKAVPLVEPAFELTEANLREEAKDQVLAAIHDAVEGLGDGLRYFLVYSEM